VKRLQTLSLLLFFTLLLTVATYTWAQGPDPATAVGVAVEETPTPAPATPQPPSPGLDIVGGYEAQPGAWPWMAALVSSGQPNAFQGQFCGGALIDPQWVLTASHCTENSSPSDIDVVLGRHTLSSSDGERISVTQIIQHPSYNPSTVDFDIALLHLSRPSSQPTIPVVGAGDSALFDPGTLATVIGWGLTDPNNDSSYTDALQQVSVPIVSNAVCNASNAYNGQITDNMLCAGYALGGKDSCSGDSGGPLMVPDAQGSGWVQAGIVSWGDGCASPNKYGVYTRVANFKSWIESHVGSLPTSTPTVTGTVPAESPTPTLTPTQTATATATVTPTPTTPPGGGSSSQILQDPGFESALSSSPWVTTGDAYPDFQGDMVFPAHSGNQYASLSGPGEIYQQVDIPADATSATWHFWWRTSGDLPPIASLELQVRDGSGSLLETLVTLDDSGPTEWAESSAFDLSAYAGQQVQITFKAISNSGPNASFYFDLDDVTLGVSTAPDLDFNHDGVVDLGDVQMMAGSWRQSNLWYDSNGNGIVDVADLMYVAGHLTGS
jgi:secreted trypsin-like serine protease